MQNYDKVFFVVVSSSSSSSSADSRESAEGKAPHELQQIDTLLTLSRPKAMIVVKAMELMTDRTFIHVDYLENRTFF